MRKILIILMLLGTPAVAKSPVLNPWHKKAHFDILEVNVYYNEWACPVFAQIICWDWHKADRKFHVEHWRLMKDAFVPTKEGEKKWDQWRLDYADKHYPIGSPHRNDWLNNSKYKGEFEGGRMWPQKNYRADRYESIMWDDHVAIKVTANQFRFTHTQYDPERQDREHHPEDIRKGLYAKPEKEEDEYGVSILERIIDTCNFLAHP